MIDQLSMANEPDSEKVLGWREIDRLKLTIGRCDQPVADKPGWRSRAIVLEPGVAVAAQHLTDETNPMGLGYIFVCLGFSQGTDYVIKDLPRDQETGLPRVEIQCKNEVRDQIMNEVREAEVRLIEDNYPAPEYSLGVPQTFRLQETIGRCVQPVADKPGWGSCTYATNLLGLALAAEGTSSGLRYILDRMGFDEGTDYVIKDLPRDQEAGLPRVEIQCKNEVRDRIMGKVREAEESEKKANADEYGQMS